jgi:hypothetical protein
MNNDNLETLFFGNELSSNELQNIYTKLSITEDSIYFDFQADINFISDCMGLIYDSNFLKIETKELQNDRLLINTKLAQLIKHLVANHNFRKIGFIFITFCDYFDLDYTKTYSQLQDKLKSLVELSTKNMVGNKRFQKLQLKANNGIQITTLFDLVKNKL